MMKSQGLSSSVVLQRCAVRVAGKLTDGSSSSLFKGVSSEGREVAIKVVPFLAENPSLKVRFQREVEALKAIPPHQNVIRVVDWKEDQTRGILAEEFCQQGNLRLLCQNQELSELQILSILKDLASGLLHIHAYGVAHRDLRPCNIFLGNDFKCRIGDFGSSSQTAYEVVPEDKKMEVKRDIEINTVPCFRAPEQLDSTFSLPLGTKVDIWGLGCLMYGLLYRENAFSAKLPEDQRAGRCRKQVKRTSEFWTMFFSTVFIEDSYSRPGAEVVLQLCAQRDVPRVIPRGEASTPFSSKASAVIGLFKSGAGWWVRAATNNGNNVPDFHHIWRLVTKSHLKPFKIGKIFGALQKRPVVKTRVAIKTLMVAHLLALYGWTNNCEAGLTRAIDSVERTWAPNTSFQGDELKCEYFAGLIRQYAKLLRQKLQFHAMTASKGNWSGGRAVDPARLAEMIAFWSKLIHVSNGLFMGVADLAELRSALAGLLMEEKLKLAAFVRQNITALSSIRQQNQSVIPALVQKYQQNYYQTCSMAASLKAFNPLLSFNVPENSAREPRPTPPEPEASFPAQDLPTLEHRKSRGTSQPPSNPSEYSETSLISPQAEAHAQLRAARSGPRLRPETTPEPVARGRTPTPKPIVPHMEDLLDPAGNLEIRQLDSNSSSASAPAKVYRPPPQEVPMFLAPQMEVVNTAPTQPGSEVKMFTADQPWILKQNQLQFGPVLGIGSSCQVHRGLYKRTPVAIKVMKANVVNVDLRREFMREVTAMLRLRHPNLVLFMGACIDCGLAIVTEFCEGESLFKLLHERKDVMLSWQQKLKMSIDVAHGMNYLHEITPPIIHRDLKSLNLLLHKPVYGPSDPILVKITDFGVSKILDDPSHMTGQMGTCHWMAPEVITNRPYNLSADVYSYGIVLWEIVCRETPYRNIPPVSIAERVVRNGERPSLTSVPSSCPPALKELMVKCWQTDPSKRPTFSEILDWLERIEV